MIIWAKLKITDGKYNEAENLIKAFFRNFNKESGIVLKGNDVIMKIAFEDEPPLVIVDALAKCDVKELSCNATNVKEFPEQVEQKAEAIEVSEQVEQKSDEMEAFEQVEQKTGENTTSKQDKQEVKKTKKATAKEPPITKIPELEEFAKKANSFEDFAKLVAKWLEMKNREGIFVSLIIATTKIDKIKWDILEETVKFSASDRQIMAQSVKNKLKEYSVSIFTLLKISKEYSKYPFNTPISKTKMNCMPDIPDFESALARVDKSQPVEERVQYVLDAMGLKELDSIKQQEVAEIARVAVKHEKIEINRVMPETKIPLEKQSIARLNFAKFINDFVEKHEKNHKTIDLETFLRELQKIIM